MVFYSMMVEKLDLLLSDLLSLLLGFSGDGSFNSLDNSNGLSSQKFLLGSNTGSTTLTGGTSLVSVGFGLITI